MLLPMLPIFDRETAVGVNPAMTSSTDATSSGINGLRSSSAAAVASEEATADDVTSPASNRLSIVLLLHDLW